MSALQGVMLGSGVGATGSIAQKGYGRIYGASATANLALSYANVESGSAPAAGDLVAWFVMAFDSVESPVVDLTGSGWAQGSNYVSSFLAVSMLAKVVVAGDISSPPTVISGPNNGSLGFWVAYSITGTIASLAVSAISAQYASDNAPSNQNKDSSALNAPDVAITIGAGGGSDNSPSMSMSGATADISFTSANNVWGDGPNAETQFLVNAATGGANITFSKGDDGGTNHMASGFVTVDF
jgi:hypothetical protein